jgi:hypothetical protein
METSTLPVPAEQWLSLTGVDLPKEVSQLPAHKVEELALIFTPFMQRVIELRKDAQEIEVTSEDDREGMEAAKRLRIAIKNARTEAEKIRKEEKQWSLITGRSVDFFGKSIKELAEVTENYLKEQETYAERMEAQRRAELKAAREDAIAPYLLEGTVVPGLDTMTEADFEQRLQDAKDAHAYRVQKAEQEEAERLAEIERKKAEQEALRAENERLRAEAHAKAEAERIEREAQERADREAAEVRAAQEAAIKKHAANTERGAARLALWKFFSGNYDLNLTQDDLDDVIHAVEMYQEAIRNI